MNSTLYIRRSQDNYLRMHNVARACTVNTSSQGKNNEASDSILVSWFNPTLKALNDAENLSKPLFWLCSQLILTAPQPPS